MKKFFLIAASAMMVLASCTKVNVNYPDNGQPQEIAMFAVNKSATKAPVAGQAFPTDYDMKVAAYLASGAQDKNGGFTAGGDYFDGTLFTKVNGSENLWTGGKYWPVSTSTLNFLAVAVPKSSIYTGRVGEVTFGTAVASTPTPSAATKAESYENFASKVVVTFSGNETKKAEGQTPANFNQFDLMYAAGQGVHNEGGAYDNVRMTFKHALSWINFTVATNVKNQNEEDHTYSMQVNSIRLSGASYGGTLTVDNSANYNAQPTITNEVLSVNSNVATGTCTWTSTGNDKKDNVYVPGAADNNGSVAIASAVDGLAAYNASAKEFGNGLLVVPVDYSEVVNGSRPTITINYTMNQGNGDYTFERTIEIPKINWEPNKKYTYALTITLNEIKVSPSVDNWDNQNDIPVDTDPVPQQQAPAQGE